jgi:hypothetical protein
MAAADVDGDADLDLFVGGRFLPGRYPEPAGSSIWLNEDGLLRPSPALSEPLAAVGLVSGATFCDLDADGQADLVLAMEWGPVRVFLNRAGRLEDVTTPWGLASHTGWWTSVAAGDFDGDGQMDLAVGNWGRNTPYQLYRPGPLRAYYNDWNSDGTIELIEAWPYSEGWFPIRNRTALARALPDLQQRFATHAAFSQATVEEILGPRFENVRMVEAAELESAVFLKRGARFERVPLPVEAQASPALSVNVGDFDGAGQEDLFVSQNFFGAVSDISRDDNGRGLWLRGNGDGTFTSMDATFTGIKVYGEQRGAALADFDHDGRVDLAVSQNDGPTKLYVNQRAQRGLRVVLQGAPPNPEAVGAQMRVLYSGGRAGPCRAVSAGSGYWSQDAAVQVLGLSDSPSGLWIRWPGGKEQRIAVKPAAWELRPRFEHDGQRD